MRSYQDSDPLHGHGKAIPKPKGPNPVRSNLIPPMGYFGHGNTKARCCINGCRTTRHREVQTL